MEVKEHNLEILRKRVEGMRHVLDRIDIDSIVKNIREDRMSR